MSGQTVHSTSPVTEADMRRKAADEVHGQVCKAFGAVLKAARAKTGMSQQKLADNAGADRSYLSMLERGLQQPTLAMMLRISMALGAPPEELVIATVALMPKKEPA